MKESQSSDSALDLDAMRRFYEIFPYPNRSVLLRPKPTFNQMAHAGFARAIRSEKTPLAKEIWHVIRRYHAKSPGAARYLAETLTQLESELKPHSRILLVGCGTDEPLLFQKLHQNSEIIGIDLSKKSIERARFKLRLHAFLDSVFSFRPAKVFEFFFQSAKVSLLTGDAAAILKNSEVGKFDHIQCFGVLHHQPDPHTLFFAMAASLAPEGTLRIMIYSERGRRLERRIQQRYVKKTRGSGFFSKLRLRYHHFRLRFWQLVRMIFVAQSVSMRFRYLGINGAAVADSFLHPSDPGFAPKNLSNWAEDAHLKMIFCEANIDVQGWVSAFKSTEDVWKKILKAESEDNLLSNVTVIFEKK